MLNHEVMYFLVAANKLSSQMITSQLLGAENVLNIPVCSRIYEVKYNN
jgi:hypothetical protein